MDDDAILALVRGLPHHGEFGREWLRRPDAPRHYPWYARVFRALSPRAVYEVGTYYGYSLAVAAAVLPDLKRVEWTDDESYEAGTNAKAAENVRAARERAGYPPLATDYARGYPPDAHGKFDLVHVDGDHSYEGAARDLRFAAGVRPLVVIGHDYDLEDGVWRAVRDYCTEHQVPHLVLHAFTHGLWAVSSHWLGTAAALAAAGVGPVTIVPPEEAR